MMTSSSPPSSSSTSSADPLRRIFGDSVLRRDGSSEAVSSLSSFAVLGLYFSAQWCPPCRSFTQDLIRFYETLRKINTEEDTKNDEISRGKANFEVIFVSADRDESEFDASFREMPWTAVSFADKHRIMQLPRKFGVKSIPALILVEGDTGRVITNHGRELVLDDPRGCEFPWRPRETNQVLTTTNYLTRTGDSVSFSNFERHIKGIYFSANWCPPCKSFTPLLVEVYEKVRREGHSFEIVFVSSDRSEESFDISLNSMPWLAVPYNEEKLRKEFTMQFGVQGIPTLIILDEENNVITSEGRFEVTADLEAKNFPWRPQLVNELTEKFGMTLNESPCLILFSDEDRQEVEACKNLLLPVANEYRNGSLKFFVGAESDVCESLRDFAQLEDSVPLLIIIDIPEGRYHVLEDDVEITQQVVRDFVDRFHSGHLESRALKM